MTPLQQISDRYDPDGDVNLAGFTGSLATYALSLAALVAATSRAPGAPRLATRWATCWSAAWRRTSSVDSSPRVR